MDAAISSEPKMYTRLFMKREPYAARAIDPRKAPAPIRELSKPRPVAETP